MAAVNNQLCFSYFNDAQAHPALERASVQEGKRMTTDTFPDNPVAFRIHIMNEALPAFREKALGTMAGMGFMTATEHLLRYMADIQSFRGELSPATVENINKDSAPEDALAIRLKAWGVVIEDNLVRTIRYLRLRRNQVAHANETPHQAYLSAIRKDGRHLEKYWAAQPTRLPDLDFLRTEHSGFRMAEVFSLMNLCFVCLERLDDLFINSMPVSILEEQQIARFIEENKELNGHSFKLRYRKFKRKFEQNFGLTLQCELDRFSSLVARNARQPMLSRPRER